MHVLFQDGLGGAGGVSGGKDVRPPKKEQMGGVERSTSELMKEDREVMLEGCIGNSWERPAAVA